LENGAGVKYPIGRASQEFGCWRSNVTVRHLDGHPLDERQVPSGSDVIAAIAFAVIVSFPAIFPPGVERRKTGSRAVSR
jgi:hypothetical protein